MKTKNILFVLALSIGLFATSCNSSDSNEGDTLAPLEGKWSIVKVGTNVNGVETLADPPQNTAGCNHDFIDLKINNTLISGDYDSTVSACALTTVSGTYSKGDSKVTMVVNGTTTTYDIVNLTLTELKLKNGNAISVYIR
ncbi:lipocalin-like protein [Flavobacterium sp. 103]|uniref:lipocalin family protein n=1 Tax=unclassified Flavobacterium TaxID=196869 RepID=UPI000D5E7622|nr:MULTISPECIES: lipocalin family protein [unclassified Flavobacterium]PVX45735.1 lipocalin-like protein [Flavobacterium sp. 103]QKJ62120.1 lipocalin family protein [Flavobacterium sp. M31R6]